MERKPDKITIETSDVSLWNALRSKSDEKFFKIGEGTWFLQEANSVIEKNEFRGVAVFVRVVEIGSKA